MAERLGAEVRAWGGGGGGGGRASVGVPLATGGGGGGCGEAARSAQRVKTRVGHGFRRLRRCQRMLPLGGRPTSRAAGPIRSVRTSRVAHVQLSKLEAGRELVVSVSGLYAPVQRKY